MFLTKTNRRFPVFALFFVGFTPLFAQPTFPQNGIYDAREGYVALTNATIYTHHNKKIEHATLVIHQGIIEAIGENLPVPAGAAKIDGTGKTLYPSFLDLMSSYGMPEPKAEGTPPFSTQRPQMLTHKKGAYFWNEALKTDFRASDAFTTNETAAKELRDLGFGAVLTHRADGISRGSGSFVSLSDEREHLSLEKSASAHILSLQKGTSPQEYPTSLMGCFALLRQTYLDAEWYKNGGNLEERNLGLEAWNALAALPQIFIVSNWSDELRVAKLAKEFNTNYIVKGSGDEYRRLDELKAANNIAYILPLNFPVAFDIEDPYDAQQVQLADLKHWELAPSNPARLAAAEIPFALTLANLKDKKDFWKNLRKAIKAGLRKEDALKALTLTPAQLIHTEKTVGSLEIGKLANFLVTTGDIFEEKTLILQNWVHGKPYFVQKTVQKDIRGTYELGFDSKKYVLDVAGTLEKPEMKVLVADTVKINVNFKLNDAAISLNFVPNNKENKTITLSGIIDATNTTWKGNGLTETGNWRPFTATQTAPFKEVEPKKEKNDTVKIESTVLYPFVGFGNEKIPTARTFLIKNATVWTNEKEGILSKTDVLIEAGKIAAIGKQLKLPEGATEIDGTDKHLTAGIIDEHSHIAIERGVNESGQESTAEVRIGDVINSEDINIYRQLAGGVTASQLLHGSANPIGGQSALIKLRWGLSPEKMKIEGADKFIKFALGENVKQSNWGDATQIRYPQTRMGVEQVFRDYFSRALEYKKNTTKNKRRDLDLETLVEILDKKRFITCHSYVQSEILMLMKVAEDYNFNVNTFTHILEGYKVAKQLKEHGANASTFSDWWGYKMEVQEAIPYNGALLHETGVNVGFNSDDAEMGRRLNQEAAKAVEFGGVSEEEAWKFVTLNPAKTLHLQARMGSVKQGKDADLVLWSASPLSVYARAEYTWVDGIKFFDRTEDLLKQQTIQKERTRLLQKMLLEKRDGKPTQAVQAKKAKLYECDTVEEEF